jgi:hypothetical protein
MNTRFIANGMRLFLWCGVALMLALSVAACGSDSGGGEGGSGGFGANDRGAVTTHA